MNGETFLDLLTVVKIVAFLFIEFQIKIRLHTGIENSKLMQRILHTLSEHI